MTVSVRQGQESDVETALRMAMTLLSASNLRSMDVDAEVMLHTICRAITSERGFFVVAEKGGAMIGGMLGMITQSLFGRDLVASDVALFIDPESRGAQAGAALVSAFVEWARAQGAKRVCLGNATGMDDEVFVGLARRCGMGRSGSLMYRDI